LAIRPKLRFRFDPILADLLSCDIAQCADKRH
jgi:hypothetical protein